MLDFITIESHKLSIEKSEDASKIIMADKLIFNILINSKLI